MLELCLFVCLSFKAYLVPNPFSAESICIPNDSSISNNSV